MKVLAFGIVKEIFKNSVINVDITDDATVNKLRILLEANYPELTELGSYMIAVNNEYAAENNFINDKDEVAIIPPVSGG